MRSFIALLLLASACSGNDAATSPVDAAPDVAADPTRETCTECRQIPIKGEFITGIQSDGTNLYILDSGADLKSSTLRQLPIAGGTPSTLASGTVIQLYPTTSADAVIYTKETERGFELHVHAGATDTLLTTLPSPASVVGNATDVYALGVDASGTTTLWRVPRAGGDRVVVATQPSAPSGLRLGDTRAVVVTMDRASLVDVPGPSTPDPLAASLAYGGKVMLGDSFLNIVVDGSTDNTTHMTLTQQPSGQLRLATTLTCEKYTEFAADSKYVYFVESKVPQPGCPSGFSDRLHRRDWSFANDEPLATWPGGAISQDATNLYGVEARGNGEYVIDILPK